METDERYLNLATINLGEAMTELGNLRTRGVAPGSGYSTVLLALRRAEFALQGIPYVAPQNDPQHVRKKDD